MNFYVLSGTLHSNDDDDDDDDNNNNNNNNLCRRQAKLRNAAISLKKILITSS